MEVFDPTRTIGTGMRRQSKTHQEKAFCPNYPGVSLNTQDAQDCQDSQGATG